MKTGREAIGREEGGTAFSEGYSVEGNTIRWPPKRKGTMEVTEREACT